MNDLVQITASDLRGYAKIALYLSVLGLLLRGLAQVIGPWLARKFPRAYPLIAAVAAIVLAFIQDVGRAIGGAQTAYAQNRVTPDAGVPIYSRPIPPPPIPPRSHDGFASLRALAFVVIAALALVPAVAFLHGCGPVRTATVTGGVSSDGGADWAATVGVTLTFADAVVPAACGVATTSLDVPEATKATIATACHDATDALAEAEALLGAYRLARAADASCRLRVALGALFDHELSLVALLEDAHVQVPPELPALVGAVGSFIDALLPACPAGDGAARVSAAQRIHAALARGGAR